MSLARRARYFSVMALTHRGDLEAMAKEEGSTLVMEEISDMMDFRFNNARFGVSLHGVMSNRHGKLTHSGWNINELDSGTGLVVYRGRSWAGLDGRQIWAKLGRRVGFEWDGQGNWGGRTGRGDWAKSY